MAHKSFLPEPLQNYVFENWLREAPVLADLRAATESHPRAGFQIPADQGQLMQMLVKLTGARRCLEIGVYTGYSALAVALALPDGGELVALDISEEYTSIGRPFWEAAGVLGKIELRIAPALESLAQLEAEGRMFNFVFIDADKSNYLAYYEQVLRLLVTGGVILFDNVLWSGRIIDEDDQDVDTHALRRLNATLRTDERIDLALIPIGDGVTIARKR